MYYQRRGALAVFSIGGYISGQYTCRAVAEYLRGLSQDPQCNGVCLVIDTLGGDADGFDEVTEAAAMFKAAGKRLCAMAMPKALSAGYYLASLCDEIVGTKTCQVGSIGVIMGPLVDSSEADAKNGVKTTWISTARHKLAGMWGAPQTPEMIAGVSEIANKLASPFIQQVAKARGLSVEAITAMDGKVFVGEDAVKAGLISEVVEPEDYLCRLANACVPKASAPTQFPSLTPACAASPLQTGATTMPEPTTQPLTPQAIAAAMAAMTPAQLAELAGAMSPQARTSVSQATEPPASAAQLRAAFASSADFCLEAIENGWTMSKAHAEFNTRSQTQTKPTSAAPAFKPVATPTGAVSQTQPEEPKSYAEACWEIYNKDKSKGREYAMKAAQAAYPELHANYLDSLKTRKPEVLWVRAAS